MEGSNNISLCKPKKYKGSAGVEYVERYPDHYVLFIPNNISQNDIIDRISLNSVGKKKKAKSNRANNSFILYRMDKKKEIISKSPNINQKYVSQICATMWKQEPPSVREKYKAKYEQLKAKQKIEKKNFEDDSMDCIKVESLITEIKPSSEAPKPQNDFPNNPDFLNSDFDLNDYLNVPHLPLNTPIETPNFNMDYLTTRRRSFTVPNLGSKTFSGSSGLDSFFETYQKSDPQTSSANHRFVNTTEKSTSKAKRLASEAIKTKQKTLLPFPEENDDDNTIQLGDWISDISKKNNQTNSGSGLFFNRPDIVKLSDVRSVSDDPKTLQYRHYSFNDQSFKKNPDPQQTESFNPNGIDFRFFGYDDSTLSNLSCENNLKNTIPGFPEIVSSSNVQPKLNSNLDMNFGIYDFENIFSFNQSPGSPKPDQNSFFSDYQFDFTNNNLNHQNF
ncbi:Mating-type protein a-1 [Smittium mucronatum]|uniref:Mating-type protein a-1 n=1 Tax=Smittium mucronatum TaxID=133383 RepID=A0A1R0GSR2_9FUNG|nr:Mating-type protein a-1 [Smittium mucronatum]